MAKEVRSSIVAELTKVDSMIRKAISQEVKHEFG